MGKSLDFYMGLLGLKVRKQDLEQGKFIDTILGKKGILMITVKLSEKIELLYGKGQNHIAFTIDNEDEFKKFELISEPQVSPDGKAKVAFCYAPEGTLIELVYDIS